MAHVTGDLWRLTPTATFFGFEPDTPIVLPLVMEYWACFETDLMPRWFVTAAGAAPRVLRGMDTEDPRGYCAPITGENWKRTPTDRNVLMGAAARHAKAPAAQAEGAEERWRIVPAPLESTLDTAAAPVDVSKLALLAEPGALPRAETEAVLAAELAAADGVALVESEAEASCVLRIRTGAPEAPAACVAGGYTLLLTAPDDGTGECIVVGHDPAGAWHGAQSFLALLSRVPIRTPIISPFRPAFVTTVSK